MRRSVLLAAVSVAILVPSLAAAAPLATQPQHPQPPPAAVAAPATAEPTPVDDAMTPSRADPSPVATTAAAPPQPPAPPRPPVVQPAPSKSTAPAVKTFNLYPSATWTTSDVVSQGLVDQGQLVTWSWNPRPCLLAGHDTMGWSWLDEIPVGSIVAVRSGPCAGRYRVVAHRWIPGHGSPTQPPWLGAAALQTCSGSGTGFSLMQRA